MSATDDQLEAVVLPALAEYLIAEGALTEAVLRQPDAIGAARELVLRRARTAAIELHQLADFMSGESGTEVQDVRTALAAQCTFLRTGNSVPDIALLRDVAEAFKHHKLDRKNARVASTSGMTVNTTGYATLLYGEGKFGGTEQVVITASDGVQRAMSSVLQNVTDAWRRHLGRNLPDIGDYAG